MATFKSKREMRFGFSTTVAVITLIASSFAATLAMASAMDSNDIKRKVSGKRIYLATPLGGEFPLFYRADGRVDGSGEASGLGRFVRPNDSGRWWVSENKLCQQWQTWYDGRVICFTLTQLDQNRIAWTQDNGDTGTARIGN